MSLGVLRGPSDVCRPMTNLRFHRVLSILALTSLSGLGCSGICYVEDITVVLTSPTGSELSSSECRYEVSYKQDSVTESLQQGVGCTFRQGMGARQVFVDKDVTFEVRPLDSKTEYAPTSATGRAAGCGASIDQKIKMVKR